MCGLVQVEAPVAARREEAVERWLDALVRALRLDHTTRSPKCHPHTLDNIMIPVDGAAKIGEAPEEAG